jgi:hypothetical protein
VAKKELARESLQSNKKHAIRGHAFFVYANVENLGSGVQIGLQDLNDTGFIVARR